MERIPQVKTTLKNPTKRSVSVAGLLILALSLVSCSAVTGLASDVNSGDLIGSTPVTYTVQAGDCLSCIAARYGVTTQALIDANRDKYPSIAQSSQSNRILVGWVLVIPAGGQVVRPTGAALTVAASSAESAAPAQPAAAPGVVSSSGLSDDELALEVVRLTNAERTKAGLPELMVDTGLMGVGRRRAAEIVTDFSHNGLRAECSVCGENIMGPARASGPFLVEHWMNSPGHRANILSSQAGHTGVGIYRLANGTVYVSQVFTQ